MIADIATALIGGSAKQWVLKPRMVVKYRYNLPRSLRLLLWVMMAFPLVVSAEFSAGAGYASAQGVVRDIQVTGNRRVEPETVRSYLQFSVGDAYSEGAVSRSIRALFATGLFSDVQIYPSGGGIVVVDLAENPIISQVAFEGNSDVENDALRSEIRSRPRSIFTRTRVQSDVQRILDVYRRQGLFAVDVQPKVIELDQSRVNLVFEINEGVKTKVKGINFIGNRAFTDQQLRDIISTTQAGWFDFLKGSSIYDPDRLNLDRELVRQYYLKNGYADARVTAANAELDRDGSGFFITIAIEEGELYKFGSVEIETSLPDLSVGQLQQSLLTKPGGTYDGSRIDKSVERLTLAVAGEGYAFARVRPRAEADYYSRTVNLRYVVDEGARAYIDRIDIFGNTRTKDYVIRREFRLAEGDAYNPLLVENAKKRLERLGIFESVKVDRRPGTTPDRVVLAVNVVEKSTGELSFGAGFSTSEGVIGDISIAERNLLGNGQFLRLKLSGSIERYQIDLSFTEPRFLDYNIAAGFDLFHKEVDLTSQSGFRSRKTGGSIRAGFPLAENLWGSVNYTLSRDQIFDINPNASLAVQESEGNTLRSSVGFGLRYDRRNHPRNPTAGYYFNVNSDFAGLGGDVSFARVQAEARGYYPVAPGVTLVGRAVAGHVEGLGEDVRLTDLFFKGSETIRGFDRAGIGPRDLNTDDALGGSTFWAVNAELRFPIPLLPKDFGISGAVFADAGSLFGAGAFAENNAGVNLVDEETVRASVGASILWNSPLGPLRVDYAHVVSSEEFDDEQALRFGAQTNF